MPFSILKLAVVVVFIALAFPLALIPEHGFYVCLPYVMLGVALATSQFQPTSNCPKYLYARWHVLPIATTTLVSIVPFLFGGIGIWEPPMNYLLVAIWMIVLVVLQFDKLRHPDAPNIGLRLAQVLGSWAIVV